MKSEPVALRPVEMHMAFFWTCEDCGQDNFERGITIDPSGEDPLKRYTKEDKEDIREWIEAGGEGRFVKHPKFVICGDCGAKFQPVDEITESGDDPS